MEMLVVIGMIAIVTAVALPKIKTIYEEFKINQTVEEVATLVSSYRSYYLVMNEFPGDTDGLGTFPDTKADWCLPRNFYTASPHRFSVKPYKGFCFEFQQWATLPEYWLHQTEPIAMEVRDISETAILDKYKAKISNLYPKIPLTVRPTNILSIPFLELPKEAEPEPEVHRNRYR